MTQHQESNRNKVRQEILLKDKEGNVIGKKSIFHPKKTHGPEYWNVKEAWNRLNKMPKEDSKRQQKLDAETWKKRRDQIAR